METSKILQSSALDILFDNRNKMYGAYVLRKDYQKRLFISLACMVFAAGIFSFFILHRAKEYIPKLEYHSVIVTLSNQPKEKPLEKKKIKIPVIKKAEEPPKIKMTKFTRIVVTTDDKAIIPPKQDENLVIGPVTQNGKTVNGLITAPSAVKGIGGHKFGAGGGESGSGDGGGSFVSVQVEAKFPGGEAAWRLYLHNNLRQDIPLDNGASAGQYVVTVSFVVSKDGTISDVKVIDAPHPDFGTSAEAVRVIQRGPNWIPAIQNGRAVTYRQKQRIIFQVQE